MIDIEHLLELFSLMRKVSPEEYMDACAKVARNPKLPPRGEKGDPVNIQRVELFLFWLIEELREVVTRKSR